MEVKGLQVTVIVLAYKRKKFLGSALDSVVKNSIVPDQIILVKCFSDPEFDASLKSKGIEIYDLPDLTRYGEMLIYALNRAFGDIIMLLEDDDMFFPNKIESLKGMYERDSDLVAIKDIPMIYRGNGNYLDFTSNNDDRFRMRHSSILHRILLFVNKL